MIGSMIGAMTRADDWSPHSVLYEWILIGAFRCADSRRLSNGRLL